MDYIQRKMSVTLSSRYWIVLSFALLLELLLERLLQNKKQAAIPFTVVKVTHCNRK